MRLRRVLALVLLALPVMNGCGPVAMGMNTAMLEQDPVDTSRILRLMGRYSAAHACPMTDMVLTCAHVADVRPFDPGVKPLPYRYQDGRGHEGILAPVFTEACSDLARMEVHSGEIVPYERASEPPKPGDRVTLLGYDWSSRNKVFAEKRVDAKVLRVVAGTVVMDQAGEDGSSGSCVLDQYNRVVAINCAGIGIGLDEAGIAVGVYGHWASSCQ